MATLASAVGMLLPAAPAAAQGESPLRLSRTAVDFGPVPVTGAAVETVEITNTGSRSLTLAVIETIDDFGVDFAADTCFTTDPLRPGETCTAAPRLAPTTLGPRTGYVDYVYRDSLDGTFNARVDPLTGTGVSPLRLSAADVDLGDVPVTAGKVETVEITNVGGRPLTLDVVNTVDDFGLDFATDTCFTADPLDPGETCDARPLFAPASFGPQTGFVDYVYRDAFNHAFDARVDPLAGVGTSPLHLSATTIDHGEVAVGATRIETVGITNVGGRPLTLANVVGFGDFFLETSTDTCFTRDPLDPGETCEGQARFSPTSLGFKAGYLVYNYRDPLGAVFAAPIEPVTGTGVEPPAIDARPGAVDFGSRPVGTRSDVRSVTVTNTGGAPLSIAGAAIDGRDADDFRIERDGCAGTDVAPGAQCVLDLVFEPRAEGARSAVLSLDSNAAAGRVDVELAGLGLVPRAEAPGSTDFGVAGVGATTTRTITVKNVGEAPLHVGAAAVDGPAGGDFAVSGDACSRTTVERGAACAIDITFTPSVAGPRAATLEVPSDAANGPVVVRLSGTGNAAPELVVPGPQTAVFHGTLDFTVHATDAEGDPISLFAAGLPEGLAFVDEGGGTGRVFGNVAAAPGLYEATFAATDAFTRTTRTVDVVVEPTPVRLAYTGALLLAYGRPALLSAHLAEPDGRGVEGRQVTLTAGTGPGAQSCTATTSATGDAECSLPSLAQPLGPVALSAAFAGDAFYEGAAASASGIVFEFLVGHVFLIGDGNATLGETVTFYGGGWTRFNSLSRTPEPPPSLEGFASSVPTTIVGDAWALDADGPAPPATVPEYMAVVVTDSATSDGSWVTGTITGVVVVRTDGNYHPLAALATGTVVAIL